MVVGKKQRGEREPIVACRLQVLKIPKNKEIEGGEGGDEGSTWMSRI